MKTQDMTQRYRKFKRACLLAEDINWNTRTICYTRKKLKSRGTGIKPALIRFGGEIETILKRRPAAGSLFPYLRTVRAGDRSTEFHQRCVGLGIQGVSLHSYRYAWAERALKCGYGHARQCCRRAHRPAAQGIALYPSNG